MFKKKLFIKKKFKIFETQEINKKL